MNTHEISENEIPGRELGYWVTAWTPMDGRMDDGWVDDGWKHKPAFLTVADEEVNFPQQARQSTLF